MDTILQPVIVASKRGPYRRHSAEFKRAVVARSFVAGASVARVAREYEINANQVFAWRKEFADARLDVPAPACQLLPITVAESTPSTSSARAPGSVPANGVMVLTVGTVQLRVEGNVEPAMLAQVLTRLLP